MNPTIELTFVPRYGGFQSLTGIVRGADPDGCRVIVCIKVYGGWWIKPYWDAPLTPVAPDGVFTADITTGGEDERASEIFAILVPADFVPPRLAGTDALPPALLEKALAQTSVARAAPADTA